MAFIPRLNRLDQAVPGECVRVVGRVRAHGELLTSPVSGRSCVAWRVRIFGSASVDEQACLPSFMLDLEDGEVEVSGKESFAILCDDHRYSTHNNGLTENAKTLLEHFDIPPERVDIREAFIAVGDEVAVEGEVVVPSKATRTDGYRSIVRRIRLVAGEKGTVRIIDDPAFVSDLLKS